MLRHNQVERFGFITTNSISMPFNRRVLQQHLESKEIHLDFAIPDHPWVDNADGANARVAFTVASIGPGNGTLLDTTHEISIHGEEALDVEFSQSVGEINSDLSLGVDLDTARPLLANKDVANNGMGLFSTGFLVNESQLPSLGIGVRKDLEKHLLPYQSGQDMVQKFRNLWVIDLFGLSSLEVIARFPEVYQHVVENVKPARDLNNRVSRRLNWWLFGETNPKLRKWIAGITRFIATPATAKHRVFQFMNQGILPDDSLNIIASDDAFLLGTLSSQIHVTWALATGADLGGNTPRYRKSRCFDPFPFPDATPQQQDRIRELAEQLDAHRKRQQAAHPTLTLTDLYNVVEKLRGGEALTAKDQTINQQGLASVVLSLHQQIDAAVADAYGWPDGLPESEILTRLVQLNHERAAEESAGQIRYLRPSYQRSGGPPPGRNAGPQQQLDLGLTTTATKTSTPDAVNGPAFRQEWPKELAQQMQAVRDTVQQSGVPLSTKQVAAFFAKTPPGKVQPLLDTLAALALLRQTADGTYAM